MLDLGTLKNNYYQIKTIEGDVLDIPTPPQKLYRKIQKIAESEESELEMVGILYGITKDILNLNIQGIKFDAEYVSQFGLDVIGTVVKDYFEHITKSLGE